MESKLQKVKMLFSSNLEYPVFVGGAVEILDDIFK